MKRTARMFGAVMIACMLAGCGKDTMSESVADAELSVTDESNIKIEESAATEIQDSETENQNFCNGSNVGMSISIEVLSDKYADCIDEIIRDCDTPEEHTSS